MERLLSIVPPPFSGYSVAMNEAPDVIKQSLIQSYTAEAGARDLQSLPDWKVAERQRFLDRLRAEGKHTLLEIGAGTGRDALFFKENGFIPTCIDLTPGMVQLCRDKGLNTILMDVCAMTFALNSYDAVYSVNGLVHLPKTEMKNALTGLARVLIPGGLFLNCIWGGMDSEGVRDKDDHVPKRFFSFYTDEQARQVFGEFFTIEDFHTIDIGKKVHLQVMYLCNTGKS